MCVLATISILYFYIYAYRRSYLDTHTHTRSHTHTAYVCICLYIHCTIHMHVPIHMYSVASTTTELHTPRSLAAPLTAWSSAWCTCGRRRSPRSRTCRAPPARAGRGSRRISWRWRGWGWGAGWRPWPLRGWRSPGRLGRCRSRRRRRGRSGCSGPSAACCCSSPRRRTWRSEAKEKEGEKCLHLSSFSVYSFFLCICLLISFYPCIVNCSNKYCSWWNSPDNASSKHSIL